MSGRLWFRVRGATACGAIQRLHGQGWDREQQFGWKMLRVAAAVCNLPARSLITVPQSRPVCAPRSRAAARHPPPAPLAPRIPRGSLSSSPRSPFAEVTAARVLPAQQRSSSLPLASPGRCAPGSRVRCRGLAHPHSSRGSAGGALPAPASCSPPTAGRRSAAGARSGPRPLPAERNCTRFPPPPGALRRAAGCACPACCQQALVVGEGGQKGGASLPQARSRAASFSPHCLGTLPVF